VAVGKALHQLEEAGIFKRLNARTRGFFWQCEQLFSLVDQL
jgi:hypothetical protein